MAKSSQTVPERVGHLAYVRRASSWAGGAATSPLGTEQDFSPPREVGPTCPAQPAGNTKSTANYPTLWQLLDFPAHYNAWGVQVTGIILRLVIRRKQGKKKSV